MDALGRILIVEDDAGVRLNLRGFLKIKGYEVCETESCRTAMSAFQSFRPDVVVSDYSLPDGNALELLHRLKSIDPNLLFLILTGYGTIDLAVQAIKAGAEQFLTKPVELPSFLITLQQVLGNRRNGNKQPIGQHRKRRQPFDPFLGSSPAIRSLAQKTKKLLSTKSPILIQGETGTGKGVLAAWLHHHSSRGAEPFVDMNCAALSRDMLESDLFGHLRGAFTGAVTNKMGLFEVAHGGTLFLDEIGDMDLQVQPKLLKVIEEKRFRRLGDVHERLVDVRIIAATHKDLGVLAQENRFRSDLYFRINTLSLKLPPLRERVEDIPALARRILNELAVDLGLDGLTLAPDLEEAIKAYHWPGNIRELRNALERAVLFCEGDALTSRDLQVEQPSQTTPAPLASACPAPVSSDQILTLSELERLYIEQALQIEHGRVEVAAQSLGLSRSALYEKIKKHGIDLSGIPKYES